MKQVLVRKGRVVVDDVPAPQVEPGSVLVQVEASCISIGTELSGIRHSGLPLYKRALQKPQHVRKVLGMVADQGIARTRSVLEGKLSTAQPTGYSAAGRVIAVGEGVTDLAPGDRVACAGAQSAHHAEVIRVPRNLTVRVPEGVSIEDASTVTLGAIALQGVRRASPTLGETFVVIGLGILGQLTVQLLRANGCRVIGLDLDPQRVALAREFGMEYAVTRDGGYDVDQVRRLTAGIGADGAIVTAATASDALIATAFQMCRKKGRVVLVGDVGLNINRADIYEKELDFFISTSYGPGRYDRLYEEQGLEYPVAYVRWTENRNLEEFLRLIADRRVNVQRMVEATYPVAEATTAYAQLASNGGPRPLMVLLTYPPASHAAPAIARRVETPATTRHDAGPIGLAVVGAGGFAKAAHLPNLQELRDTFSLRAVVTRSGHNATAVARQFGAAYASTDLDEVLADASVHAVIIATRHDLHMSMALRALEAGKHVLVEKPLAITAEQLAEVRDWFEARRGTPTPVLLTGYNRRFSRFARRAHELLAGRSNPVIVNYRMNAGWLPPDHWTHSAEGGGRNIGEACHIYDLFAYIVGHPVAEVSATALAPATAHYRRDDNFVATLRFADGSVASLTYTALGSTEFPKEQMEIYSDGRVLSLNDYRVLTVTGARAAGVSSKQVEKGQLEELQAFGAAIRSGSWPITLEEQLQTAEVALAVQEQL